MTPKASNLFITDALGVILSPPLLSVTLLRSVKFRCEMSQDSFFSQRFH